MRQRTNFPTEQGRLTTGEYVSPFGFLVSEFPAKLAVLLSILICSLETRQNLLDRLLKHLKVQATPDVEIVTDVDNGEVAIGAKRNRLLSRSVGRYLCFFDDDDLPAPDYVSRLRGAIKQGPDCVGFYVRRLQRPFPGHPFKLIGIGKHTIENGWQPTEKPMGAVDVRRFATDQEGDDLFWFIRPPNHLTPVRREIALATRFPEKNIGEDRDYATSMMLNGLLKTEVFIDGEPMYDYLLRDHSERNLAGEVVHPERWVK